MAEEFQSDLKDAYEIGVLTGGVGHQVVDGMTVLVVPDGEGRWRTETLDLEQYQDHPRRKKGRAIFRDEASFTIYVNRHKGAGTLLAADQKGVVTAELNHHAPTDGPAGWADHVARLERPFTPAWLAWQAADGRDLSQRAFAEFLEDRISEIVTPDGAALLEIATQFSATKEIVFASAFRLENGDVKLEYRDDTRTGDVTVPTAFVVRLQPFRDGAGFDAEAKLRYRLADGGKLTFRFVLAEDVAEHFEDLLEDTYAEITEATELPVLKGALG